MPGAARALAWPLQAEALASALLLYVLLGFFHFTWRVASGVNIVAQVAWIALAIVVVLGLCVLLSEYGLEILAVSAEGQVRPPLLRLGLARIQNGDRRFLRQLLWLALWYGLAQRLGAADFRLASTAAWLLLACVVPATLINNTVYRSFAAMCAPWTLVATLRRCGLMYVPATLCLAAACALAWLVARGPALLYLAVFPLALYSYFLACHLLGLCVYRARDEFFPPVDFTADRRELQETSDALAALNTQLTAAHEWLRAGEIERACQRVLDVAQVLNWARLDKVFAYVSQWQDARPAVRLCRSFLDSAAALARPLAALDMAGWALQRDPGLCVANFANVEALIARAATPAHFTTVFRLLENSLPLQQDAALRQRAVAIARDLAANKLKDENLYARALEF